MIFEYIILVFGLNTENNFMTKFFSGITFTVLSVFLIHIPFTLFLQLDLYKNIIKILSSFIAITLLISYSIVKYRSQKMLLFYEELKAYQKKNNQKSEVLWSVF